MQTDLFGGDCVSLSLETIREFCPGDEGYYVAFSGGKDSVVLLDLVKRSGVPFDAHYNVTGIDPPELMRFIRDECPEVRWEKPLISFRQAMLYTRSGLPFRQTRWCCEELKEHGGDGRHVLTGIRAEESRNRRARRPVEHCQRKGWNKVIVNPLLHWTTDQVWQYIRERALPYCCLYDEGWKRIGCVPCPFASGAEIARSRQRWPRIFDRIESWCNELYPRKASWQARWASGSEVFEWWLDRTRQPAPNEAQEAMAFDQFGDE